MKLIRSFQAEPAEVKGGAELEGRFWKHTNTSWYKAHVPGTPQTVWAIEEYRCEDDPSRCLKVFTNGPKAGLCEEYEGDMAERETEPVPAELDLEDISEATRCARVLCGRSNELLAFCEAIADGDREGAYAAASCFYDAGAAISGDVPDCEWTGAAGEADAPAGWTIDALEWMVDLMNETVEQMNDALSVEYIRPRSTAKETGGMDA